MIRDEPEVKSCPIFFEELQWGKNWSRRPPIGIKFGPNDDHLSPGHKNLENITLLISGLKML